VYSIFLWLHRWQMREAAGMEAGAMGVFTMGGITTARALARGIIRRHITSRVASIRCTIRGRVRPVPGMRMGELSAVAKRARSLCARPAIRMANPAM
jgi:hypothetical protein